MRKVKILLCMVCVSAMLFCSACFYVDSQKYACDVNEVKLIQIVRLEEYNEEEDRFEYTVLTQVSDHIGFTQRLNNLKQHSVTFLGDPATMYSQCVIIRIEYRNGDFDEIYASVQCLHRSGVIKTKYFSFDVDQFDALIADYMPPNVAI